MRCPFCVALWLSILTNVWADEGMYPISELSRLKLPEKGLQMTPAEIFTANQVSLIDGICKVNGCTGSFVSPDGLIITNHHCAYRAIQSLSSTDQDYLANGFSAKTRQDELFAKGYTVRITESYQDVSDDVLEVVNAEMSFAERTKAIERRQKELEKQAEADHPEYRAEVAEMFQGKTYYLFFYTYIKDVRLVFAPPASVGNFGGDVDNWEWPRHTGDFSFMRAYVAPDGSTADYSAKNVPYKPKRHVQVAARGANEGDFVFLLGYPGRTARHKTSAFLLYEQQVRLPFIVDLYQWQIETMDAAGAEDRAVALKHTSRSKSLANVEKRSRGQLKGLKRAPIIANRQTQEAELQAYIDADPTLQSKYGSVLQEISSVYDEMRNSAARDYTLRHLRDACRALAIAYTLYDAAVERQKEDLEREAPYMDRNFDQTKKRTMLAVRDFHAATDQAILAGMIQRLEDIPAASDIHIRDPHQAGKQLTSGDDLSQLYSQCRLGDEAFVEKCWELSPEQLAESEEPFLRMIAALYPKYVALREQGKQRDGELDKWYGELLDVKQKFMKANFVPDANATLRMTFGKVEGYSPEDAVIKTPITTLSGVVDKTTGIEPFITPQRILDMHASQEFGKFAHPELNDVPVAILYSTDTTGGNSGSPIFNAKGELVGVNFDRAFEATINDFAWNHSYSRSIGVDIRYALWITGDVFGATRLLDEMGVR